jgi:magnesium transporter
VGQIGRFRGLTEAEAAQIDERRAAGGYVWIDLDLETTPLARIAEVLGIPPASRDRALGTLADFDERSPLAKKFHADDQHVVFPFFCVRDPRAPVEDGGAAIDPVEVHVLVHGEYLLTLSEKPFPLQELIQDPLPEHRTERYVIYAALEEMSNTVFEALAEIEASLEEIEEDLIGVRDKGRRRRSGVIKGARARLTALRRRVGPQRAIFERVGQEIEQVEGLESDDRDYFGRVLGQLDRIVDGIDAASESVSTMLDLSLNEITYRLTVVATIFLPLSFITGFFGMNFDWMITRLDTAAAFLLLGLGSLAVSTLAVWYLVRREERGISGGD